MEWREIYLPEITTLILFILLFLKLVKSYKCRRGANLPPQPWTLPFIGNLHQLASSSPHRVMRDLANKCGPLMQLQLGDISAMVVSSAEVAKEVMKTHDIIFASRPSINIATAILSNDSKNLAFAPYGEYWRELRKICTLELLSSKCVLSFQPLMEKEMEKLVKFISSKKGKSIDIMEKTLSMNCDIIMKAICGKTMKDTQLFLSVVSKALKFGAGFSVEDFFPSLPFIHIIGGVKKKLKAYHKEIDKYIKSIISEHDMSPGLLNALLKMENDPECHMTLDHVKAVLLDLLIGGIDTTATLIQWAMAEMMKNPNVLKKVQAEVRQVFDQQGVVDGSKLHELKYMHLVIKEVFRLHPPVPLLLPRCNSETCIINGYEVPANTKILINAWAIARDPKYWVDSEKFKPERFVDSTLQLNGNYFEYMPFGSGRRMCPALTFGLTTIELVLANILFHFDWKLPNGMQPDELNMSECFGATMAMDKSLLIVPVAYKKS